MYSDNVQQGATTNMNADNRNTIPVYERILELFEAEGVKAIFGIPDPNFVHMFVAAEKRGWTVVTPHHELAAGMMAECADER